MNFDELILEAAKSIAAATAALIKAAWEGVSLGAWTTSSTPVTIKATGRKVRTVPTKAFRKTARTRRSTKETATTATMHRASSTTTRSENNGAKAENIRA